MVAMALGILIVTTFVGVRTTQNIKAYNQGINAAIRNDWQEALTHLYLADQLAPMPFYQRQLGFVAGYLAEQGVAYRGEAINHYKVALSQLDQLPLDHANLACLLWANGQRAEARQEMALAHQLEPDELLYQLNLGYYLEMEGNYEAAWDEYARVIAQQPDYLQSSYWRQTEPRVAALPKIIEQAVQSLIGANESNSLALAQLYFQVNNFERALQIYDDSLRQNLTHPVDIHLGRAKILFTMGRFSEAKAELQTILELNGMMSEAYLYLSKIALAENDIEEAKENIEASLLLGEDGETLYQAALVTEAAGDQMTAIEQYEAAFAQLVTTIDFNSTRYETEVARRYPLPASYLPCLIRIYPTSLPVDITKNEGELLERQGDHVRAVQVYRRLLVYEPTIQSIAVKLDRLCRDHPEICGD
jgi:tetratricopeptide (TPR) repeat protein